SGARVVLAGRPDVVLRVRHSGQVAVSVTAGGSLSRGTRGQVSHSEAAGEVSLAGLAMHSGAYGRLAAHSELPGTRGAFGGFRVLSLGDFRRGWRRWHSGHVAFSERLRRRFRRRLRRGRSVGLRDGSERIRDTRRAPKGSERGGASRWLSKGLSGRSSRGSSKRVAKGCSKEGAKRSSGGCEGVVRR